jgi:hypothetical protein
MAIDKTQALNPFWTAIEGVDSDTQAAQTTADGAVVSALSATSIATQNTGATTADAVVPVLGAENSDWEVDGSPGSGVLICQRKNRETYISYSDIGVSRRAVTCRVQDGGSASKRITCEVWDTGLGTLIASRQSAGTGFNEDVAINFPGPKLGPVLYTIIIKTDSSNATYRWSGCTLHTNGQ